MKPRWIFKLLLCGLLCSLSVRTLHQLQTLHRLVIDDSLLVCARESDRQINCMVSRVNILGQQHDGQEVTHVKKASLDFARQSNGKLSNASRVLLVTEQGEQVAVGAGYTSRSQPEFAAVVTQVNQFLQSQEPRLEVTLVYSPRFFLFLLLAIVMLGLLPIVIQFNWKLGK
jgi:hypothetical protein